MRCLVIFTYSILKRCHIKVNASSCTAQYPILRIAQSALHFTSLTDLFNQTPSQLLWVASSHLLQLMHEGCSYTYPLLSIARNLPKVLTPQHRIQTWVVSVESLKLYPWAIAYFLAYTGDALYSNSRDALCSNLQQRCPIIMVTPIMFKVCPLCQSLLPDIYFSINIHQVVSLDIVAIKYQWKWTPSGIITL